MYVVNEDNSIYVTRGDIVAISLTADDNGENYKFKAGDVVRIKVFGKKDCENVVLQKDFPVTAETETVEIYLDENDTKIGGVINKPVDYWYEVELNPESDPQTIIGYDEDGARVFKLFPEGRDLSENDPVLEPEDIPIVDTELDLTSKRPVENRAIARAVVRLQGSLEKTDARLTANLNEKTAIISGNINELGEKLDVEKARVDAFIALEDGSTTGDAELQDIRVDVYGETHNSAGEAVRSQIGQIKSKEIPLRQRIFADFEEVELTVNEGAYDVINKTVYSSADMRYAIYTLNGEEIIKFSGYSHGQPEYFPACAFVDGNGNVVQMFGKHTANTSVSETVVVPTKATQIVVNGRASDLPKIHNVVAIDSEALLKDIRNIAPSRLAGYEQSGTTSKEIVLSAENTTLLTGLYDSNGIFNNNSTYYSVVYPITEEWVSVDLSKYVVGVLGGAFLDVNKNWLMSFSTEPTADKVKTIPNGACYIAITTYANNPYKTITANISTYKLKGLDVGDAERVKNLWKDKKIVWIGTSVPFGAGAETSYAVECAKHLDFELVNCSVPSLAIHTDKDGKALYGGSLVLSKAEYEEQGIAIASTPLSFVAGGSYNNYYTTWENVFCKENSEADLYVFDIVPNNTNFATTDWEAFDFDNWCYKDGSGFEEHRTTFLGAVLFLMDKMYAINENARMAFVIGSSFTYASGKNALQIVKDKWKIPVIDVWGDINTSPKSKRKIFSNNGTDPHPSTLAHKIMGQMLVGRFLTIG